MKDSILRTCPHCTKTFFTKDIRKIYCNSQCRFKYWNKLHPRMPHMVPKKGT